MHRHFYLDFDAEKYKNSKICHFFNPSEILKEVSNMRNSPLLFFYFYLFIYSFIFKHQDFFKILFKRFHLEAFLKISKLQRVIKNYKI